MMASLSGAGQEHRVRAAIFRQSQSVSLLQTMMRFNTAALTHAICPKSAIELSASQREAILCFA
jgi:hypothetical protein